MDNASFEEIEKADRKNDIGLTQAFAPIADDAEEELADGYRPRPASDRENDIGLTQAFSPITSNDEYEGKSGFSSKLERFTEAVEAGRDFYECEEERAEEEADAARAADGRANEPGEDAADKAFHAKGFSYTGDTDDATLPVEPAARGRHSKPDAAKPEVPTYMRKSHRMRRILIVVVVLLVILLAAGGFFAVKLFQTAQTAAYQQTQQQQSSQEANSLQESDGQDSASQTVKKTSAPNLTSILGVTQDEAIAKIGKGAQVTSTNDVSEEGNPIKTDVRVALTDEPADTRTGTPTVYLGLDEDGKVVQAGYSAGTASLGYGALSFSDAVKNESIIEKTLQEAGIQVPTGTVTLPADKTQYSTYASDGTTLVKEYCPFTGQVDIDGAPHTWSAVLSYDYTVANASGNLADTIRIIYVYINA